MDCHCDLSLRPLPLPPWPLKGSGAPLAANTLLSFVSMGSALMVYPEPQLRVLTHAVAHLQPWVHVFSLPNFVRDQISAVLE